MCPHTVKLFPHYENEINTKIWLAGIMAKHGDQEGLIYLKEMLVAESMTIKSEAARVLFEIGENDIVYPQLIALLKDADDYKIRERAIESIVYFNDRPLMPLLGETLLKDKHYIVREIAAWAMGERKDKTALPYLEKGLHDESAFVRTGVVAALYKILSAE